MDVSARSTCAVLLLFATTAHAELASSRDTLRGHQSVFIAVMTPDSDDAVRQLGLVKTSLERYLVDRLEKAQIRASAEFTDQTLILEVRVDIHRVSQSENVDVFAFISRFDAIQAVQLANRTPALATTWRATQFGAVTHAQAELLRSSVVKNLEQFILDWKAAQANPDDRP